MRIVGGKLRHRIIKMTNLETTRETQDKVRQAIYNMIGPYFDGGVCLDLFAGSGAMGIEAYSRGMSAIHLNDLNNQALSICKENCSSLKIEDAIFTNLDYVDYVNQCKVKFDLIILDPPYMMDDIKDILNKVYYLLKDNGLIVFEMGINSIYPQEFNDLALIKDKTYGIKRVVVYRK
ncbi:MAG: 16S rRNA (guanine(966)-N(2))-methyltransferase RsmD [Erysipelotrichaceae bacterium]|nr:16S rRNA (guanine(966)-N(2))-methyltransferase RsmD [Erysipelotrichaceae bacterium]